MQSFSANDHAIPPYSSSIRPALTSFADEVCATVARLFAYVGVLMLFGILGLHAWDRLQVDLAAEPAPEAGWSVVDHSSPAFALSPRDASDKYQKSDTYVVLRHPADGRKDIFRWSGASATASADWLTDGANPRLRGAF